MSNRGFESERPSPGFRQEIADVVAGLLTDVDGVSSGKMFGHPAFYIAGRMFACAYGDGLGVKVPGDVLAELGEDPSVEPFSPYGRRMREWIFIRHADPDDYRRHESLILESAAYVKAHEAKASGRKNAKGRGRR